MERLKFYDLVTVNDIQEIDYVGSSLKNFSPRYEMSTYRIVEEDLMSPDLISYKVYRTEEYWWLIMRFNKIVDIFTDLAVGDIIYVPSILDIYDFYKANRRR
jgi:hypothetical protein